MNITNTASLATQAKKLDSATTAKIFYGNQTKPKPATGYQGIYNMGTGKLAAIASKQYQIIQHKDVFESVAETLKGLKMEIQGELKNYNNVVIGDVWFTNGGVPVKDDEKGLRIGMRIMNSYNKKCSFRLEMFAFRLVCSNGMTLGSRMGVSETTFHVGEAKTREKIAETVEKFIKQVINSSKPLQALVNAGMKDSIEWKLAERILRKLVVKKKHFKALTERLKNLKPNSKVTRWDLYNALTNYISHDTALKPGAIRKLEKHSQKLLETPLAELPLAEIEVKKK